MGCVHISSVRLPSARTAAWRPAVSRRRCTGRRWGLPGLSPDSELDWIARRASRAWASAEKLLRLRAEGIDHRDFVERLAMLKACGKKPGATGHLSGRPHLRVPPGEPVPVLDGPGAFDDGAVRGRGRSGRGRSWASVRVGQGPIPIGLQRSGGDRQVLPHGRLVALLPEPALPRSSSPRIRETLVSWRTAFMATSLVLHGCRGNPGQRPGAAGDPCGLCADLCASRIDAGPRAASAGEGGRGYDEPVTCATPQAVTWRAPADAGRPPRRARSPAEPRRGARPGTAGGNGARDAVADRQSTRLARHGRPGRSRLDSAKRHVDD